MKRMKASSRTHFFVLTSQESIPRVYVSLALAFDAVSQDASFRCETDITISEFTGPWSEDGQLRLRTTWERDPVTEKWEITRER